MRFVRGRVITECIIVVVVFGRQPSPHSAIWDSPTTAFGTWHPPPHCCTVTHPLWTPPPHTSNTHTPHTYKHTLIHKHTHHCSTDCTEHSETNQNCFSKLCMFSVLFYSFSHIWFGAYLSRHPRKNGFFFQRTEVPLFHRKKRHATRLPKNACFCHGAQKRAKDVTFLWSHPAMSSVCLWQPPLKKRDFFSPNF